MKLDGVALQSYWDTDGQTGYDRKVGSRETSPSMLKATCFGEYPDLSIKVEGPDDAVLLAKAGETTMNVRFAEMGPVDITPPASQYTWGPTGVELSVNMGTGNEDKKKRLPEVFGTMYANVEMRMLVTCP